VFQNFNELANAVYNLVKNVIIDVLPDVGTGRMA
jgi:hypothetical protein